jgi:predicted anti-sigma-YlaC factor YlaD
MNLIDSTTPRDEVLDHLGGCASCASLFAFARSRGDLEALARWRMLLAEHLANEEERQDFDRDVLARLGGYRRARRENEEAP